VYLLALAQNGYENAQPAGVIYQPAKDPPLNAAKRGSTAEDYQRAKLAGSKPDGFVLQDCENPHKLPVMSHIDLARLRKEIDRVLGEIAHNLRQGKIPALPVKDACDWCDYQAVCGRECGGYEREIPSMKFEQVLAQLEEVYYDGV